MPLPAPWSSPRRDADNELYDRGCDLVEAAARIHAVAESSEAAPAIPAFLGCLESALHELTCAVAAMQESSEPHAVGTADPRLRSVTDRMQHGFTNLTTALADAEAASRAARSLTARTIVTSAALRDRAAH
jgi:hypothetical protein